MECRVLSDSDKLKAIRKKYNLKQDELSGKDITRNLISEIETGTANITKKTAQIVIKNLKEIANKKHVKVTETVEYLMENEIVQATKVLDDYIEELKALVISKDGSFIEILKKAESFLIDWDIKDKKLKIYELAGDYFRNNNELYKSAVYYEKASALLSRMFLDKELLPLLRKLSIVYGNMGNYEKSIDCCEFALNRFNDMSLKDKVIFTYNNATNYFDIKNFQKALNTFEKAESIVNKNDTMYIKILNNKANCLYEMKLYKEALKVFNEIWGLINRNETDKYLINLINIVNSYWYAGMKDISMQNFDAVIKVLPNLNNNGLCVADIYFEIGKIYARLDKFDLSENYYLKALDFCKMQKKYVLANNVLGVLIDIYTTTNNIEKMKNVKENAFFIANRQGKINNEIMYKLIVFYNKMSNEIVEIGNFVLKF